MGLCIKVLCVWYGNIAWDGMRPSLVYGYDSAPKHKAGWWLVVGCLPLLGGRVARLSQVPWVQLLEAAGFSLGLGTRLNIHVASFPGPAQLPSLPYYTASDEKLGGAWVVERIFPVSPLTKFDIHIMSCQMSNWNIQYHGIWGLVVSK